MIYTVTLNPSIDYLVRVDDFEMGKVNRTKQEAKYPGGKGINVSRVLKRMGNQTTALGFIGGQTGSFVKSYLEKEQIPARFTEVPGDTRINIKLKSEIETEINGQGPEIPAEMYEKLMDEISRLQPEDMLVLSGSIPSSVPKDVYETIVSACRETGIKVAVDTSGPSLTGIVKAHPFLIKPNHHELGDLFSVPISSSQDAMEYGTKLVEMGAENVIVSMAGEGAILCTGTQAFIGKTPKGSVVNSVGAGDSMVAGFIGTYEKTLDIVEAFRFSLAAGSATAFSSDLCTMEDIEKLLPRINVQEITGG